MERRGVWKIFKKSYRISRGLRILKLKIKVSLAKFARFPIWINLVLGGRYVWLPHKDGNNITAITALGNLFSVWFDENAACNIGETRSSERNTLPTATVRLYEPSAALPP